MQYAEIVLSRPTLEKLVGSGLLTEEEKAAAEQVILYMKDEEFLRSNRLG